MTCLCRDHKSLAAVSHQAAPIKNSFLYKSEVKTSWKSCSLRAGEGGRLWPSTSGQDEDETQTLGPGASLTSV